jgi:hypothetical protein
MSTRCQKRTSQVRSRRSHSETARRGKNFLANTQRERLRLRGNHAPEPEFSLLLTTMAHHVIMSAKRSRVPI